MYCYFAGYIVSVRDIFEVNLFDRVEVVIRLLHYFSEKIDICFDSFIAEAIAVRFGMNLARTVGCSKIEINLNSVEVIASLIDGFSSSFASAVFEDCYFMSLDFTHVVYEHCNRERNLVAHELARIARFSTPNFWLESAPETVIPFIVNDVIIVMNE
ncbi:hypothetical protein ZWY2020_023317 [Hordeum vulgare]|nr:hypothetical protein ZWY2020_023317 [Hordeum vulgare]